MKGKYLKISSNFMWEFFSEKGMLILRNLIKQPNPQHNRSVSRKSPIIPTISRGLKS